MTKILVLGGTRYLGRSIVTKTADTGYFVATLSRSNHETSAKHFICDRKNTRELSDILSAYDPHIIIDMVNFEQKDSQDISALYDQGCCKSLRHYVMISSFFVYNEFDHTNYSERQLDSHFDLLNTDGYTRRKIEAEMALYDSRIMDISTILRLPFIFSADDYSQRFQKLCEFAMAQDLTKLDNLLNFSLLRKEDAAINIIKIIESDPIGIADLSNQGCVTSQELAQMLKQALNPLPASKSISEIVFPYSVNKSICLNSKKHSIDLPLLEALKIEAHSYKSLRS